MTETRLFFYLEDDDLLTFESRPLETGYEEFPSGLMGYNEYVLARENLDGAELPGRFELAREALHELPETMMAEPYAYSRDESRDVDRLAAFGERLEPGEESREAFLEKADEYNIDQLVKMPVFTDNLRVEVGELRSGQQS